MAITLEYPFEVRPLDPEEGGGYLVTFPDLPGCMSDGETVEEAIRNAADALESYLKTAREFGDSVPAPGGGYSGNFRLRVPKSLHAQLDRRAKAEKVSMNTLVVSLIAEGLGRRAAGAKAGG